MDDATVNKVLPTHTLYKKGKISKRNRLIWQMDGGRLFIRRECCGIITNITTYNIAYVEIAGEIIGYSTDCLECRFCGVANHFVLDRWKRPSSMLENAFHYARKVVGDDLKYSMGGVDRSGMEWLYLQLKDNNAITVRRERGAFFPMYNRSGESYTTLSEALKAGVDGYRSQAIRRLQ